MVSIALLDMRWTSQRTGAHCV